MKLEHARNMAESLKVDLGPYCERIEVGGSVRREKAEVKDIELVCIPKFEDVTTGQYTLWEEPVVERVNLLFKQLPMDFLIVKMGERYCQCVYYFIDQEYIKQFNLKGIDMDDAQSSIKVDVFTAAPETWGYIYMIRTGPREFSKWVVTELKRKGYKPEGGTVLFEGEPLSLMSEKMVFDLLGIDYIEPEDRSKVI